MQAAQQLDLLLAGDLSQPVEVRLESPVDDPLPLLLEVLPVAAAEITRRAKAHAARTQTVAQRLEGLGGEMKPLLRAHSRQVADDQGRLRGLRLAATVTLQLDSQPRDVDAGRG